MKVIYEPKGAALEYAPLAANLYRGCSHGCRYCYAPGTLRTSREAFARAAPRPGVIAALKRDVERLQAQGEKGPVLLCFTCDPYQPLEKTELLTRKAIHILGEAGLGVRVLTKNGLLARRDLDLFQRYRVEVGVTLVSLKTLFQWEWEPGAGHVADRTALLRRCREAGVRTWVSIEPVFSSWAALEVIDATSSYVDTFKVGKLNHDAAREREVDWTAFLRAVLDCLAPKACGYYIKNDLWAFADGEIRESYPRERGPQH